LSRAFGVDVDAQPSRVAGPGGLQSRAVRPLERLRGRGAAAESGSPAAGLALEHGRPHGGAARWLDREAELIVLPGRDDAAEDGRLLGRPAAYHGSTGALLPDAGDCHASFPVDERRLAGTPKPAVGDELPRLAVGAFDDQPPMRLPSRERPRRRCRCGRRNPAGDDCAEQDRPLPPFFETSSHEIPPFLDPQLHALCQWRQLTTTTDPRGPSPWRRSPRPPPPRAAPRRPASSGRDA